MHSAPDDYQILLSCICYPGLDLDSFQFFRVFVFALFMLFVPRLTLTCLVILILLFVLKLFACQIVDKNMLNCISICLTSQFVAILNVKYQIEEVSFQIPSLFTQC